MNTRADLLATQGTVSSLLMRAASQIAAASASPRLDVEVLLAHVMGTSRERLITWPERTVNTIDQAGFHRLVQRRATGEPIAYLTGHKDFWTFTLQVSPETLIPRPETELLVEQTLARIPRAAAWTVADLGTGSGAVALAIAQERPACRVIATDLASEAIAVARRNRQRLDVENVEFRVGDWLTPLRGERVQVIASNPPYVRASDPHLAGAIRFEPRAALQAGADGLEAIVQIASHAPSVLQPEGWLLLEHGYDQAEQIATLLHGLGYRPVVHYSDLAGVPRVIAAQLSGDNPGT